MKTLLEEIADTEYEIHQRKCAIAAYEKQLKELKDRRVDCQHEWGPLQKNYEHEGVWCKKCGINDMFARTMEKQRGQQRKGE